MAERIDLSAPDQATPGTPDYRVVLLTLAFEGPEGAYICIGLQGSTGQRRSFTYEGDTARAMIVALNKADLSVKSLQRRILERLVADGKLAGVISGVADAAAPQG
jgi:hypothetical protein